MVNMHNTYISEERYDLTYFDDGDMNVMQGTTVYIKRCKTTKLLLLEK